MLIAGTKTIYSHTERAGIGAAADTVRRLLDLGCSLNGPSPVQEAINWAGKDITCCILGSIFDNEFPEYKFEYLTGLVSSGGL